MLTKKQIKIFDIFQKNKFKEISFKKVKELSKENSTSIIQNALKSYLAEKLIIEKAIGTSKLYSINHENNKVYSYFELLNRESLSKQVIEAVSELEKSLDKHTFFYAIVIFGSYVGGEEKKTSDLDIAVFIENNDRKKVIEAVLKSMELKTSLKIDGHTITKEEFLDMLKIESENLGKEIVRKHLIIHNPVIFYSLIKEGMKNGFKF